MTPSKLSDISIHFDENSLDKIIQLDGGKHHTSWNFIGGFKKGDSYLSEVYRFSVNGVREDGGSTNANLVIKIMPNNIGRRRTFRSFDFFRNEINFYDKVWKKFKEFQAEKTDLQNPFVDIPKCYSFFCDGENDYIALDDLSKDGYGTVLRQNGMDFQHCKLVMKILGRFHALSLALNDQKPAEFKEITNYVEETYYAAKYKSWYNDFMKIQIEIAKDSLSKECGGTELEKEALQFLSGDLYDKMVHLTHTRNKYSVINHGDCWAPNFLIRYKADETGKQIPQQIKLIDFQLARYSSPALDLSFFINSCTSQELREKHYDQLIGIYHKSVTDFLTSLGSDATQVFPFEALQSELREFARFGCVMGIEAIPFSLLEDDEIPDLDLIEGNEAVPIDSVWILKPIKTKEGRLRLTDLFKFSTQKKYLN